MQNCAPPLRLTSFLAPVTRARCRQASLSFLSRSQHDGAYVDNRIAHKKIDLDSSTVELLNDMSLGVGAGHRSPRRKRPLIYGYDDVKSDASDPRHKKRGSDYQEEEDLLLDDMMTESEEMAALDEVAKLAGDDMFSSMASEAETWTSPDGREARLSPAAAFGSKRIGMVVLPEELSDAIQKRVDASDNRKLLRQAYLSKISTKKSPTSAPTSRSSSKRAHLSSSLQEHNASPGSSSHATRRSDAVTPLSALLSAIVDLPGEYAAVRNVLKELMHRVDEREWQMMCGRISQSSKIGAEDRSGKWAVIEGGIGAGLWALQDALMFLDSSETDREIPAPPGSGLRLDVVHGSRHILELARSIAEDANIKGEVNFSRLYRPDEKPSVILAPYYLSKLPNQPARRRKLQELWDTGAETIVSRSEAVPFITRAQGIITNKQILIDEGSIEGFRMIADARQYLLDLGRQTPVGAEGLDREDIDRILLRERRRAKKARQKSRAFEGVGGVIEYVDGQEVLRIGDQLYYPEVVNSTTSEGGAEAFEPIEDKEDLDEEETVSTQRPMISDRFVGSHVLAPCPHDGVCPLLSTRDSCHFSQRLQTPRFARKTKHKKDGESDSNYSYVIIRRGKRPEARTRGAGLIGAVAKEESERNAAKEASMQQGMIVPIKGAQDGSYEVMRYIPPKSSHVASELSSDEDPAALEEDMRREAYQWPRLVYPPLKRSGHVVMDTCHPNGHIVRLTIPKSQSKQAYYDARKANWGDLFPHAPKSKEKVRERGVKRLNKFEPTAEEEDMDDLSDITVDEDWPVAKLVDISESAEGSPSQTDRNGDLIVRTFE